MKNIATPVLEEALSRLQLSVRNEGDAAVCDLSALGRLRWKGQDLSADRCAALLGQAPEFGWQGWLLRVAAPANAARLLELRDGIEKFVTLLLHENPQDLDLWGNTTHVAPSGFSESDASSSHVLLEKLYKDDYIVREKKALVIDLNRSWNGYIVSVPQGENGARQSILDGAAQISTLGHGFNHPMKRSMLLREELRDPSFNTDDWDVSTAFARLLREESGLPHVHFVNSGTEATETCLRACQVKHPQRRRLLAFEGSFHGRSVLALHATHSPAKRQPFESYPELVGWLPFPEHKTPHVAPTEPAEWLKLWSEPTARDFEARAQKIKNSGDALLAAEVEALLAVRTQSQGASENEKPLALIVEPMQCEGGDRYASARFFRGLRLLTRALDVPLLFDEVQCYGLGGGLFWFKHFNLVDAKGQPDSPDGVWLAKKSQVGVAITAFPNTNLKAESCAASLYRGYLQSIHIQETDLRPIEQQTMAYLQSLQQTLGAELFAAPRVQGLAFAFDLPTADILNALIAVRFPCGTLFYQAGDRTARFRLLVDSGEEQLAQLFVAIYKCFLAVAAQGKIKAIPAMDEWLKKAPPAARKAASAKGDLRLELPWDGRWVPRNKAEYLALKREDWIAIFGALMKRAPHLLRSPLNQEFPLERLASLSAEELWAHYEKHERFALLDLLWVSARAFGHQVRRYDRAGAEALKAQIAQLEEDVYEPARRDDPVMLVGQAASPQGIFLAAVNAEKKSLDGICVAGPLRDFRHVAMVKDDPEATREDTLYSVDLTVHPSMQGRGLGLRLKCEQYICALAQGTRLIRSRNRWPEAATMVQLNRALGAVAVAKNTRDYGGEGTALYQSIPVRSAAKAVARPAGALRPALFNKQSLGNFVSRSYVNNLLVLKEFLPDDMRHIYLANGRSETLDKAFKLLRSKRPQAKVALSFANDRFGGTTAVARSLGDQQGPRYFDSWPLLKDDGSVENFEQQLQAHAPENVFGFFVEPTRDARYLQGIVAACRKRQIPVIYNESATCLWQGDSQHFLVAGKDGLAPDVSYFFCGGQLGVIAASKDFFLNKALAMISTWDGDEHSLNLFTERLLRAAAQRS